MSNPTFNGKYVIYKLLARPEVKRPSVFLADSIAIGAAIDWQSDLISALSNFPIIILNPRRDDWNKNWEQNISNPQFKEQVRWELDNLKKANMIAMFLQPGIVSSINLLKLDLHAGDRKLIVCYPEKFERKGNVQIICEEYRIPLIEIREELTQLIRKRLKNIIKGSERISKGFIIFRLL